jgi:drug/metabolite transporter (DMT)-like permease
VSGASASGARAPDPTAPGPPPREGSLFRGLVGLLSVTGSLIGFGGLFFIAIPAGNRDALMLALGIVFGWGSAVVQSEYGASNTGRKMADLGLRSMERR